MRTILPIRVYYEDTDLGGIVYHANYLKFFERGRVEALRTLKLELNNLLKEQDTQFVVRTADIQFLQPARLDQLLYVVTEIIEVRQASIRYNQAVFLEKVEGLLLCQANIQLAAVNSQLRPRGLPKVLLQAITKETYCGHRSVVD